MRSARFVEEVDPATCTGGEVLREHRLAEGASMSSSTQRTQPSRLVRGQAGNWPVSRRSDLTGLNEVDTEGAERADLGREMRLLASRAAPRTGSPRPD
jgi:hypothetical protein